jgi:hypothetical protein
MSDYRVVALAQDVADEVRRTLRSPRYGHPAHVEVASGYGPCRLCLEVFREGEENRILFTHDPFPKGAALPSPGPIFVHEKACSRYAGDGFPAGLAELPLTLEAYDSSGLAVRRVAVSGSPGALAREILSTPGAAYAHIRNTEAGCFIARVEPLGP